MTVLYSDVLKAHPLLNSCDSGCLGAMKEMFLQPAVLWFSQNEPRSLVLSLWRNYSPCGGVIYCTVIISRIRVLPAQRPFPPSRTASQLIFYWEQAVAHLWSVRLDGCRWAQELASQAKPQFVIAFHLPALTHPGQWNSFRERLLQLARRVNTWFTDGFKGLYVFDVVRRAGLRAGQIIRAPESVYASSQTSLWKFSL